MTEVPKIVHDRLRTAALDPMRNAAEPMHPDANLLAAFAERALTAEERDGVLEHLVLCGDCRDAVALALPAENVGALPLAAESEVAPISRPAKPVPRKIFAWPSLRWAALAAGIAVVGTVLLLRPGKLNQPSANRQIASNAVPLTAQGAPSVGTARSGASPIATPSVNREEANPAGKTPLSKDTAPRKFAARQTLTPTPGESAMLVAGNKKSLQPADKLANMPGALTLDASVTSEPAGGAAAETTEASAQASEPSVTAPDASLMADYDAPAIEKAKPALQGAAQGSGPPAYGANQQQAAGAAATPAVQGRATARLAMGANSSSAAGFAQHDFARTNSAWMISAGILQRSLDGGQTWQDNLRAEHALLCYASRSNEIWAGGQGGALYHSVDGGLSWIQVHPGAESRQLVADISRIELRNSNSGNNNSGSNDAQASVEIVVSTSNHETWTSGDGGKSWKTK